MQYCENYVIENKAGSWLKSVDGSPVWVEKLSKEAIRFKTRAEAEAVSAQITTEWCYVVELAKGW